MKTHRTLHIVDHGLHLRAIHATALNAIRPIGHIRPVQRLFIGNTLSIGRLDTVGCHSEGIRCKRLHGEANTAHHRAAAATTDHSERYVAYSRGTATNSGKHHLVDGERHHRGLQLCGSGLLRDTSYVRAVDVVNGAVEKVNVSEYDHTRNGLWRGVDDAGAHLAAYRDGFNVPKGGAEVEPVDRDGHHARNDGGRFFGGLVVAVNAHLCCVIHHICIFLIKIQTS
mmetsp:Transcript_55560/g.97334  ORF Transcript_55560/g.97334 Transcript_55560/m.97334 type:complete len:226 (+) Transcript_55560:1226-1903(+)